MRAQTRPRRSQVPSPISGMRAPFASTTCMAARLSARLLLREAMQEQRAPRSLAREAGRVHRQRHRATVEVVVELAGYVAHADPRALLVAQRSFLLGVEFLVEPAEALVEDRIPDRGFAAVAIGRAVGRSAFRRLGARRRDDENTALAGVGLLGLLLDAVADFYGVGVRLRGLGMRAARNSQRESSQ